MVKQKYNKKIILVIIFAFLFSTIAGIAGAYAYFTSRVEIKGKFSFGELAIDTNTTNGTKILLTAQRNSTDVKNNLMPGDTVNVKIDLKLTDSSVPAYYLAYISSDYDILGGKNNYGFFVANGNTYATNGTNTYLVGSNGQLTGSDVSSTVGVLGKLNNGTPVSLQYNKVIDVNATQDELFGDKYAYVDVAAIQQANLSVTPSATVSAAQAETNKQIAYSELQKLAPVYLPNNWASEVSTLASIALSMQAGSQVTVSPAVFTKVAFNAPENMTGAYELGKLNGTNISVVVKPSTISQQALQVVAGVAGQEAATTLGTTGVEVYLVSDSPIFAPSDSSLLFCANTSGTNNGSYRVGGNSIDLPSSEQIVDAALNKKTIEATMYGNKTGVQVSPEIFLPALLPNCLLTCTELDMTNFYTDRLRNAKGMFAYMPCCQFDLSDKNLNNLDIATGMFANNLSTSINLGQINSQVRSTRAMFYNCQMLTNIGGSLDVENNRDFSMMFENCNSLNQSITSLLNGLTSNNEARDMSSMFDSCYALTSANLSLPTWRVDKVTNMNAMFARCASLTSVDLSNWDMANVTNTASMFRMSYTGATQEEEQTNTLTSVKLPNSLTFVDKDMFKYCSHLTTLAAGTTANSGVSFSNNVVSIGACAFENSGIAGALDLNKVTEVGSWAFKNCVGLTSLDLGDSIITLRQGAFEMDYTHVDSCLLTGTVVIPSTLRLIERCVFMGTKLTDIQFANIYNWLYKETYPAGTPANTVPDVSDYGNNLYEYGDYCEIDLGEYRTSHGDSLTITDYLTDRIVYEYYFNGTHDSGYRQVLNPWMYRNLHRVG